MVMPVGLDEAQAPLSLADRQVATRLEHALYELACLRTEQFGFRRNERCVRASLERLGIIRKVIRQEVPTLIRYRILSYDLNSRAFIPMLGQRLPVSDTVLFAFL